MAIARRGPVDDPVFPVRRGGSRACSGQGVARDAREWMPMRTFGGADPVWRPRKKKAAVSRGFLRIGRCA
jgi:hypothetical protein